MRSSQARSATHLECTRLVVRLNGALNGASHVPRHNIAAHVVSAGRGGRRSPRYNKYQSAREFLDKCDNVTLNNSGPDGSGCKQHHATRLAEGFHSRDSARSMAPGEESVRALFLKSTCSLHVAGRGVLTALDISKTDQQKMQTTRLAIAKTSGGALSLQHARGGGMKTPDQRQAQGRTLEV